MSSSTGGAWHRGAGLPGGPAVGRRRATFSGTGRKKLCSTSRVPRSCKATPLCGPCRPQDGAVLQTGRAACQSRPLRPQAATVPSVRLAAALWPRQACVLPLILLLGPLAQVHTAPDSQACRSRGTSSGAPAGQAPEPPSLLLIRSHRTRF